MNTQTRVGYVLVGLSALIIAGFIAISAVNALSPSAFAVYTEDRELLLCKRYDKPSEGDSFEGQIVNEVFELDEDALYGSYSTDGTQIRAEWNDAYIAPVSVRVLDQLKPRSCAGWFQDFDACELFDISKIDTSRCESFESMFEGCDGLKNAYLSGMVTSRCRNVSGMFWRCDNLGTVDLTECDFTSCQDFSDMFCGCNNLYELTIDGSNFRNAEDLSGMFYECSSLTLDCSTWRVTNVEDAYGFNSGASGVIQPNWPEGCRV